MKEAGCTSKGVATATKFLRTICLLAAVLAILCYALPLYAAASEEPADAAENKAEWTVLFYLCGSDLESKYGYASENLEEIAGVNPYRVYTDYYARVYAEALADPASRRPGTVNVVLETGGSKEWHAGKLGMEISPKKLQRWHLVTEQDASSEDSPVIAQDEELELASMADPETLSDFIRWGAERYPAEKYALVLWDHGGGSKTGLFIDELFSGDVLYLDELHTALQDGGVTFETVLFDACMMANLETACAIKNRANWMVASEELVAGKGTAMDRWLQQLFDLPECTGEMLGRWICDMTQRKYADEDDEQTQSILTWSVIDLSKVDALAENFDRFFEAIGQCYQDKPGLMTFYAYILQNGEEYGLGQDNMYDLASFFYSRGVRNIIDTDLYRDMLNALTDAVVYSVRGTGRSRALGIAYCLATDFSAQELAVYARNCPSAHYLAFLDAITPAWSAPDTVYEGVEKLPDIREIEAYQIRIEKRVTFDGTPGVFDDDSDIHSTQFYADLYRLNEETGETVSLGSTFAFGDEDLFAGGTFYSVYEPWRWPAVEGIHCHASLVSKLSDLILINIPIQIGTETSILRCGYEEDENEEGQYTIYGVWEGYDLDSAVPNRNVKSLAQLAGQDFSLLYPVVKTQQSGKVRFESSEALTMYRSLEIKEETLPVGTYYLNYWARDMFMRCLPIGRVEMAWDGQTLTLSPEENWEGEVTLELPES